MQLDIILHGIFYGSNIRNNIRNIFDNYSKHFFCKCLPPAKVVNFRKLKVFLENYFNCF